ncbi:MAG: hypothetical protein U0R44_01320 [Candidatus Micrarchaeia archaeon]
MTKPIAVEPRMDAGCGGSGILQRAGEKGLARALAERANALVETVYNAAGKPASANDLLAAYRGLREIEMDSDAPSLCGIPSDRVHLRCRGDPFEIGRITNLREAVAECRAYLDGELDKRGYKEHPANYSYGY